MRAEGMCVVGIAKGGGLWWLTGSRYTYGSCGQASVRKLVAGKRHGCIMWILIEWIRM